MAKIKKVFVMLEGREITLDPKELPISWSGAIYRKVQWLRARGSDPFRFLCIDFCDPNAPLKKKTIETERVTCNIRHNLKKDRGDWEYEVSVIPGDGEVQADAIEDMVTGGRGVIRNQD